MPLVTRRKFTLAVTTMFVTLALTIGSCPGGRARSPPSSRSMVDAKKIPPSPPKDGGDDVVVTIKDDTEWH